MTTAQKHSRHQYLHVVQSKKSEWIIKIPFQKQISIVQKRLSTRRLRNSENNENRDTNFWKGYWNISGRFLQFSSICFNRRIIIQTTQVSEILVGTYTKPHFLRRRVIGMNRTFEDVFLRKYLECAPLPLVDRLGSYEIYVMKANMLDW